MPKEANRIFWLLAILILTGCWRHTLVQPRAESLLIEDRKTDISAEKFNQYLKAAKSKCAIDSAGNISGTGYALETECKDVCSTYLLNRENGIKTDLACAYDQGIRGVVFSPSCKKLLTYAGYDGPDYTDYYEFRSEIYVYKFHKKSYPANSPGVIPGIFSKQWSIAGVVFIDDNHLALKLYDGEHSSEMDYRYAVLDIR